ncbi:alpha-L-fucosidase [Agromyces laixinhei]|uniref:alpha-L-fucosidase n=1 Tax=Agromyces laixinhei TaxID=2585717 RepID=UPI0012EDA04F|nr:alpha-L-fucosidase [Agromyces laixinhei]
MKIGSSPATAQTAASQRQRRRAARRRSAIGIVAALGATIAGIAPTGIAAAASGDDLDIRFGGSLVGTTAYTTTEGESMRGVVRRIAGGEEQLADGGVRLHGGTEGVRFEASEFSMGGGAPTTGFLAEVEFTPTADAADLSTIFSTTGNLFARMQGGQLVYGFDSYNGSSWSSHRADAAAPSVGTAHQLSLQYFKTGNGAELHAWLDGVELTTITSDAGVQVNPTVQNVFGFGNEVHPAGGGRGLVGDVHRVRVVGDVAAYDPELFEFQPAPITTSLLDVQFDGTTDAAAYLPIAGERLDGALTLRDAATVADGELRVAGSDQAADFTATESVFDDASLDRAFVIETEFTASGDQADLATIAAVGGNLTARYRSGGLQYGFSAQVDGTWHDYMGSVAVPASDEAHVLSLAYVPGDTETKVIAWLDGAALPEVTAPAQATRNQSVTSTLALGNDVPEVGGRGFDGTIERARFALLNDAFAEQAFRYQELEMLCEPMGDVSPANYIQASSADCPANILAKAALVRPTEAQLDWQELGLTAFVHFGINTFYDQEWGHGTEDLSRFDPTDEIDVDAWVKSLRDSGHRMAILTLKHHDGFLLYPSRYSDYDVASTPWKDGRGDIVREFTDAAHKYGMKVGLYMSPADSHEEHFGVFGNGSPKTPRTIPTLVEGDDRAGQELPTFEYEATDYGAYFLNTLYEVLTQYGQVDEVWFDGAQGNTGKQEFYDYPAFYDLISSLQPNAVVAVGGRDVRWVGNEHGTARHDEWAPVTINDLGDGGKISLAAGGTFEEVGSATALETAIAGGANALHWWPTESDMKLTQGWFAHPTDVPKSPSALLGHYLDTVGRNSVMLLNTPPTTTGAFAPASVSALDGFAAERRKAFTRDHALGVPVAVGDETSAVLTDGNSRSSWLSSTAEPGAVTIDLGAPRDVSRIELGEGVLEHGQVVEAFSIDAEIDGVWVEVATGGTIGQSRIVTLNETVTAQKFRVSIDGARAAYSLATLALYEQLTDDPGKRSSVYLDCAAPAAGDGSAERPFASLEQFRTAELAVGAEVHLKSGMVCADSTTPFWGYGTGDDPITVSVYGGDVAPTFGERTMEQVFGELTEQGWVVELPSSIDVMAETRCIASKAYVTVKATNNGNVPVSLNVASPYGERAFPVVEPGKNAVHSFAVRSASVPAGTVTVEATRTDDASTALATRTASYDARACR